MNFWQRIIKAVQRDDTTNWLTRFIGTTGAKQTVNVHTSLGVTAVYACQMLIADTIAALPWMVQQYDSQNQTWATRLANPIHQLINGRIDSSRNGYTWRHAMLIELLATGNAFAEIIRNDSGAVLALEYRSVYKVGVVLTNDQGLDYYTVDGRNLPPENMLHLKLWSQDGILGRSPIEAAKEQISTSLQATKTLGAFYGNGGLPKGIISIKSTIRDPDQLRKIGRDFDQNYSGFEAGGTAVLSEGAEYKPVQLSTAEAKFLEALGWGTEEIARLYGVPPHKIGHLEHGVYNNSIEAQNSQYVSDCIRPKIEQIETEFQKVLPPGWRLFFDMDSLYRGDIQTQTQRNVSYWNIGAISVNEIRRQLGLPPVENGDTYNQPAHMQQAQNINNGQQTGNQGSDQLPS